MISSILNIPRIYKKIIAIIFDILLSFISTWIAFSLRLEQFYFIDKSNFEIYFFPSLILILIFYFNKIYSSLFRYIDKFFIIKISKCILIYGVIFFSVIYFLRLNYIPRSIGILQPLILLTLILSQRALVSSVILNFTQLKYTQLEPSLIYGVNESTINLLKILKHSNIYKVFGFVKEFNNNNDKIKVKEILGVKTLDKQSVDKFIKKSSIKNIIFLKDLNFLDDVEKDLILDIIFNHKLKVLTLNSILTSDSHNYKEVALRNIDIEDLLKRKTILPIKDLLLKNNYKKNILITGAAGSIGSEISRQVFNLFPNKVILLDNNEFEIYNFNKKIFNINNINYKFILGDINDEALIKNILSSEKIDTIYHCAAYKHVPILEENIFACIKNNILGTYNLLKLSLQFNVKNFVFISTDKAVNAESVMGKSKRFCEIIIKSISEINKKTKFSIVRFGNVLDSRGSVMPLFKEQIKNKMPITLTDFNMRRFFMTIPEAAELVIQTGALDSSADIFVLDMGKEIKIYDIIKQLLAINNLSIKDSRNIHGDVEIKIIGLRSGEKLSEELVGKDGYLELTKHPRIKKVIEDYKSLNDLEKSIEELKVIINNFHYDRVYSFFLKHLS
jgi:nucleoside-diphosphate-sugar epimerase